MAENSAFKLFIYTGTSVDRDATWEGVFIPDGVFIWSPTTGVQPGNTVYLKMGGGHMPDGDSLDLRTGTINTAGIHSLLSSGVHLTAGSLVNGLGESYYGLAYRLTSGAVAHGMYTINDPSIQLPHVETIGWAPALLFIRVAADASRVGLLCVPDPLGGVSNYRITDATSPGAWISDMSATGFTQADFPGDESGGLGPAAGIPVYWVAFGADDVNSDVVVYTGDGAARTLSVSVRPQWALTIPLAITSGRFSTYKDASMGAVLSAPFSSRDASLTSRITAFDTVTPFNVDLGTSIDVNELDRRYTLVVGDAQDETSTIAVDLDDVITIVEELIPGDPEGPIDARSKLCVPFNLPDCSVYANPENAAALLPEVYGDFTFGGLRGAVPAVCVDTVNFVYAAAGHAVTSIIAVFVDDVEQTIGVDCTINLATDHEGQGILGIIVFSAAPGGQVSWRGGGRAELDGTLITNPIRQLEYALRRRAGFITEYFEATALAQAKFDCDTLGYQTAWVIGDDREIQQWLTEWLFNVMGFWRVDGRERLQFMVDTGGSPPESQLVGSIIASHDVVDGDDGIEMLFDRQHLVNDLTAYYLYSWSLGQPSSRIVDFSTDLVAQRSKNAHGEVRKAVTLRGLRVEAMLRTWASILFQRQGFASRIEGAIVSFTVKHAKLIHATIGDYIALTWAWGPTREEGNQYINEILRVQAVNHDFARGGKTRIRAIDLGAYISASESGGRGAYFDADDDDQYNAELFFGGGRLLVPLP